MDIELVRELAFDGSLHACKTITLVYQRMRANRIRPQRRKRYLMS